MRLKQIKLAGFKSFVDPTAFEVPSQLVGVVGPNGCGKSNIMDAVRWVLGESRASELRGESMQDVIFSGSSERKPSARASVELVFDNSLGRIGGSWGTFAEISVKRILTRDGQSTYQINNQTVRRKDVHDIFLGTGLGPRAYAIIGQGMISRIIEARPEELRVFLEEAAGVSRYKERRKETGSRLADTRENLTRVDDLLRELGAQVDKLERQAEVARQFRENETDRDTRQRMLWLVRRDEALAEQSRLGLQAAEAQNRLEESIARQREAEAQLEALRAAHYAAGDDVHAAQGRYYDVNAEVVRLESDIRFVVESQAQLRERLEALGEQEARATRDAEDAHAQIASTRQALEDAHAEAERIGSAAAELGERQPAAESAVREARESVEAAKAEALATQQGIALSSARQQAAQQALDAARRRHERLRTEASEVETPEDALVASVREALAEARAREVSEGEALLAAEDDWRTADAARAPAQQALREAEARQAQIDARITALRQLQERAQSQGRIVPWLTRHGLESLPRLWQRLRIEDGWETAIESILRERVESQEVGRLETAAALMADAPPAKVAFFSPGAVAPSVGAAPAGLRPLVEVLRATEAGLHAVLAEWLLGCFAADSLDDAVRRREALPPGGRFVTRDGHIVGRNAIQAYALDAENEGLLARQHELEHLGREARAQQLMTEDTRAAAARAENEAATRLSALSAMRESHADAGRRLAALTLDAQRLEQQLERAAEARGRIDAELAEVGQAIEEAQAVVEEEGAAFERLDGELAERQQHAEDLALALESAEEALVQVREAFRQAERSAQEASFAIRETQGLIERLEARAAQSLALAESSRAERAQCEEKLAELSDTAARHGLEEALGRRVVAEQALNAARARLEELTQSLRERDEQRLAVEREQDPLRQRVTEMQLKEQAARLNAEQYAEQLAEAQVDEAAVRAAFPEPPKAAWLQAEVTRLNNAIAALGPVNLAALEELQAASERKGFLDAQSADLLEAISTLEDAIRHIDRETREVLKDTYDTVNREFGKLFPELFGGGEAKLILTGEEILDAGVQVMAQPPGKRNTSIHLLSGGEKALTAIALVFAMFQLNPAPFCLLDEVDAPLDDANTERYADMVRRMSDQTQFLFITHNKIAMELAQQLVGVTMQERGVSRIVAVDLESAARMVEAA